MKTAGDELEEDDSLLREIARAPDLPPPAPATAPEELGPFQVRSLLGRGGMGVVYRAEDRKLHREVALKVLRADLETDPERRRRFEREARAAAAVSHPNIATVYEVGESQGRIFIAMELVGGPSLRSVLANGALPLPEALRIARQIASGLAKAHAKGIVHRDLKPDNVMLDADGQVKILDFGLARESAPAAENVSNLTDEGQVMGTPAYMSPEQASGFPVDARSDLFSLGVVLYEMVTGRRPFEAATKMATLFAIARDEARPPSALNPALPPALDAVIAKCLAKKPEDRFANAGEVISALELAPATPRERAVRLLRRAAWPLLILALVTVVAMRVRRPWRPRIVDLPKFEEDGQPPSFSPDGKLLAYGSDREQPGFGRIYVMALPGGLARPITPAGINYWRARFTRDSRAILAGDGLHIRRFPLDGGPSAVVAEGGEADDCGDALAVVRGDWSGLRLVERSADGRERVLYNAPSDKPSIFSPRCDKSGRHVLFVTGATHDNVAGNDLAVIDRKGGVRFVTDSHDVAFGGWTPQGTVVFSSLRNGKQNLYEMPLEGGPARQLTFGDGPDFGFDVSPDGRALVFEVHPINYPIFAWRDGKQRKVFSGAGAIRTLQPTPDGTALVSERMTQGGEEVAVEQLADGAERVLSPGRRPFLSADGKRLFFIAADDPKRLLEMPWSGGAPSTLADLPAPIIFGAEGPDGVHLLLDRGQGATEGWLLPAHGAPRPEGTTGLVIPAPRGAFRILSTLSGPTVANLQVLPPADGRSVVSSAVVPQWLDERRFAYVGEDEQYHLRDAATGAETVLPAPATSAQWSAISADGRTVFFTTIVGHVTRHLIANFSDR